jgi:hypothetical protein
VASVTAALTIANPTGTTQHGQLWRLSLCSTGAFPLTFGNQFRPGYGLLLPLTTTGPASCDLMVFQRDEASNKWDLISTTQGQRAGTLRTCMIDVGSEDGAALTDANIGPQHRQCLVPSSATIDEITVTADAGTPTVMVHTRLGTTDTPLLTTALATGAAGAVACAKTTAIAGITTGVTCSATLTNTSITKGAWIGTTSGTAGGVAKQLSIAVSYYIIN